MVNILKNIKSHGVKESDNLPDKFLQYIEEIRRKGYTVIPNMINANDIDCIRKKIDNIYETQVEEIGGEENLNIIGDQGFVMSLLSYDKFFIDYAVNNNCLDIVEYFLGDYFQLFCQNAVINQINRSKDQIINMWHRDFNYLHFTTSRPIGINIFFCVDDFQKNNGATYILPGSHQFEKFPGIEYAEKNKIQVIAKAGSALVFDAMLFHRAGRNLSKCSRRTMTNIYTYPFIKQQINLSNDILKSIETDENKRKILGFTNKTLDNVKVYRKLRLKRKIER